MKSRQVNRVEHWDGARVDAAGKPGTGELLVVVGWEHRFPCRCVVLEAVRDKGEPVVGAWSCGPAHRQLLEWFNVQLVKDVPDPARALHDVIVERLSALGIEAA